MDEGLIDRIGEYLKRNRFLAGWGIVLVIGFLISVWLNYEDYLGSVMGYDALGTVPVTPNTRYVVGAVPQVAQLILSLFVINSLGANRRSLLGYGLLWFAFFLIDAWTDFEYLVGDQPLTLGLFAASILQAIVLYTAGSEWLLMVTFALLFRIWPDVVAEWTDFFGRTMDAFVGVLDLVTDSKSTVASRGNNQTKHNNQNQRNDRQRNKGNEKGGHIPSSPQIQMRKEPDEEAKKAIEKMMGPGGAKRPPSSSMFG